MELTRIVNLVGDLPTPATGVLWHPACFSGPPMTPNRSLRPWLPLPLLLLLLAVLVGSCNTPSVPLPPPDLGALSFTSQGLSAGTMQVKGMKTSRHASVLFGAFDETHGEGVLVTAAADGSFTTEPFAGGAGDRVELYYEREGERSEAVICTVTLDRPLDNSICH